jgi:NTP pyrophosphatase (non-canonical NTP hydrolase)
MTESTATEPQDTQEQELSKLTQRQKYAFIILKAMEEGSEVTHALCKMERYGPLNENPNTHRSNAQDTILEIGDAIAAYTLVLRMLGCSNADMLELTQQSLDKLQTNYPEIFLPAKD